MKRKNIGKFCMFGGLLLITAALCLIAFNIREDKQAANTVLDVLQEIRAEENLKQETDSLDKTDQDNPSVSPTEPPEQTENDAELEIPDYVRDPQMKMPEVKIKGQTYIGVVDIPALKLSLPVISEWTYSRLKLSPCRYQGSAYLNNLIIMAHNYKSHFGTLKNLKIGDEVYFTDMDENVFAYEVSDIETLGGTAIENMKTGDWDLTLFTCTIGGKTRVTVRCTRLE